MNTERRSRLPLRDSGECERLSVFAGIYPRVKLVKWKSATGCRFDLKFLNGEDFEIWREDFHVVDLNSPDLTDPQNGGILTV